MANEVKEAPVTTPQRLPVTVKVIITKVPSRTVSDFIEPPVINLTDPGAKLTTTELPLRRISDNEEVAITT